MGVTHYAIILHPAVVTEDLPRLDASWRKTIRDTVREKLATTPELYGRPLRKNLKGCWKLRVGDYRVVFRIQGKKVIVLAILHHSVVYEQAEKRF